MSNGRKGASFFKIMLASMLGIIMLIVIMNIFLMIMLGVFTALSQEDVNNNSVLVLKLNSPVVEQQQETMKISLFNDFIGTQPAGLNKILSSIKYAKTDDRIKGILLDLTVVQASLSELSEIKAAIEDFKTSGKFVVAQADFYTHSSYYIATSADKLYITPTGNFLWKGFAAQIMYFKGAFEKLDIQPQIVRHGKFKSAVEPYMLDTMSAANRLQTEKLLSGLWNQYLKEISAARNIDLNALNLYADSLLISSSQKAVSLNLVDQEKHKNDVIVELKTLIGIDADKELSTISLDSYAEIINEKTSFEVDNNKTKIAIIYAEGGINSGKSTARSMGSETISDAIRRAANNKSVKAIVFRINSPGGSALASEAILHEIELAKAKKPVVVSMGRYAASGGYYIACKADKIYAEPYTITGSIGVFGMMFNIQELLNNKLGVNVNVVKTNNNSDFGGIFREMNPTERNYLQSQIEEIYDVFITHVAEGRNMSKEDVDEIGQGRVWAATDAKEIGLVDEIAGIDSAISYAAQLSELSNYEIIEYPEVKSFFDQLISQYQTQMLQKELGVNYKFYENVKNILELQGIQTRLPYGIDVY